MDILLIDSSYNRLTVFDQFNSFIWAERYFTCGDFEITVPASSDIVSMFGRTEYVQSPVFDAEMRLDAIELTSDPENGDQLKISGHSLSSILGQRIIESLSEFTGTIQDGIKKLINENVISPANEKRKIANFIFKDNPDPELSKITVTYKYKGDNLLEAIESLCSEKKVGFRTTRTADNVFVFELYLGVDRSYRQFANPMVCFSNSFENLINSNYLKSVEGYSNVAVVDILRDSTDEIITVCKSKTEPTGLARRELYLTGDGSDADDAIRQRALEELDKVSDTEMFEGEVDLLHKYRYGKDFSIGDIVQIENDYGMTSPSRVVEFVYSESDSGIEFYPTFEVVKE